MWRTLISADSERGLGLVRPLHKIGPADTVSFEAQNEVWIDLNDVFAELLNGSLIRIGVSQESFVCILVCSPANDLDRVPYRTRCTRLAEDRKSTRLNSSHRCISYS